METIGRRFGSLAIIGGLILSLNIVHAQRITAPVGTMSLDDTNVDWNSLSDSAVALRAIESTTPIPAAEVSRWGTFYSAQHPDWPPLPGNIDNVPCWPLDTNLVLLDDFGVNYAAPLKPAVQAGKMTAMDDSGPPSPGDAGGGGTNSYSPNYQTPINYGTNSWIAGMGIISGNLTGIISNSLPDVYLEFQTKTNLAQNDWSSAGGVYGSELTNWTSWSLPISRSGNLFIRIRSWADNTGTGIPDWWWLQYFGQITNVDANADPMQDGWSNLQKFQLGLNPTNFCTPPAPTGFYAYTDSTGTNVALVWNPSPGPVQYYTLGRYDFDWETWTYDYTLLGQAGNTATSFQDQNTDPNNSYYELAALYTGGSSPVADSWVYSSAPASPSTYNLNVTAQLVRNQTGRWQIMFSGLPTNSTQVIQLTWTDINWNPTSQNISIGSVTNGIYKIPDTDMANFMGDSLAAQLFGPNGEPGQIVQAGVLPNDAPYFVDGRQHSKQNLNFLIRSASLHHPYGAYIDGQLNQSATNFEEFSFLHHVSDYPGNTWAALDNLFPFVENYYCRNFLVDTARTDTPYGSTNFNFQINFANSVPAPPILNSSPYGALQPGFLPIQQFYLVYFVQDNNTNGLEWGVTLQDMQSVASLQSGLNNVFGLPYQTGIEIDYNSALGFGPNTWLAPGFPIYYQSLSAGSSVTAHAPDFLVGAYASQCPDPNLQCTNYYFAPLLNPYKNPMNLPLLSQHPYPLPIDDTFNVTNQTPPCIVGTIGQPMILGGWAKYSIRNGSTATGKYGYLGQYFGTNVYLLNANGTATTNSAGILSPYGEFFPMQAGLAALVTMPDIDPPYQQGTGVVRVVSLNVDANHDGILDPSYAGPDFVSTSKPFRFWCANNNNVGDFGGDGIPDNGLPGFWGTVSSITTHGRRNLEDFFPVYLNIGSVFQSNALSAGISLSDTNWHFILSQSDLKMALLYTTLTPTNYMNYLRDTNVSGNLADVQIYPLIGDGSAVSPSAFFGDEIPRWFLYNIATNNGGIILVEAYSNTVAPIVLTIYHYTNQVVQTSLPLSITSIEQMFRHKNLLLNPDPEAMPDRLNDWDVPNEPDTINKNFVFVHGYNVNGREARGVAADMFKRMYWSGSHAKFYAVTWEGADTKSLAHGLFTPNYHSNVFNAFNTAPNFAVFVASLTNGPTVTAAHSLGNMVVLDSLNEYYAPISQHFMIDAAVPMEAIDPSTGTNIYMVYSDWRAYSNRLYSANWYNLFTNMDYRSTLAWSGRLANFNGAQVYNFYSSGEEVLREWDVDPPTDILSDVLQIVANAVVSQTPKEAFVWVWQEKSKGRAAGDTLLGSTHGGWRFNTNYASLTIAQANALPASQLQTNAFVDFSSPALTDDLLLEGIKGNLYAYYHRNRILSDAIPALSLPAGANPVPGFTPLGRNFDMQALYENGWPEGRPPRQVGVVAPGEWWHSDFHQVAYTFTYHLFDQLVTVGNLK